ncbi:MAG: cytochrome P460 family protein [Hyphomicrobiaceae bacterium]|nr:cytochrome P460 family protein [Hyphomicrobiaceae bacterium]
MKALRVMFLTAVVLAISANAQAPASAQDATAFPADYKTKFTNYLSLDRTQNNDQIIRLFANDKALAAAKAGEKLPDGSVIVGEIYKARLDKDGKPVVSTLGRKIRDKLAVIAVMERRDGFGKDLPQELQNDGWDFAAFKPDGSSAGKDLNQCRACHAPLTDTQHLFSLQHMK